MNKNYTLITLLSLIIVGCGSDNQSSDDVSTPPPPPPYLTINCDGLNFGKSVGSLEFIIDKNSDETYGYNGYLGFDGTRNAGQPLLQFFHEKYEDRYMLYYIGSPLDENYSTLEISRRDLSATQTNFFEDRRPEMYSLQCKPADLPDTFLTYLKVKENMNKINY